MLSRLFWVALAGVALVAGIAVQERDWLFPFAGEARHVGIERATQRAIEARVEQEIAQSIEEAQVVGANGRRIDVAPQTKHELGEAIRRLVSAETDLVLARVRHGSDEAVKEATTRRDTARADVERLKAVIKRQDGVSDGDESPTRDRIRQQIREDVRETVRDAVRN